MSGKNSSTSNNHIKINSTQQYLEKLNMDLKQKKQRLEKGTIVTRATSVVSISGKSNQKYFWQRIDDELQKDIIILQMKITQLENYLREEERSSIQQVKTAGKEFNGDSKIAAAIGINEKSKITVARRKKENSKKTVAKEINENSKTTVATELSEKSNARFSKSSRIKSRSSRQKKTVSEEISSVSNVNMTKVKSQSTTVAPVITSGSTNEKNDSCIRLHSKRFLFSIGSLA
ncbi:hypothetical protein TBLA_0H02050 [Henningerozyma blattae CBS 6284]|uniref:Uncharacterized protein n=1 Tax=Henningerozyma blattae (strain ATCC 34711 / CBS 6284 / DSM 70876 / NBRC 10599 / NRRL Y-10934 / UCD 77-7) TaxID=1071380 RepID=I2H7Y9_HENB6|nr:hypothetical protein TBLA_0H02050 [Tetrapisispora blattae CBS 6284]CCH62491.1 hypothetical protein TBLA_0H02050 [Tetrapisispora blattae CBS 6284]